MTEVRLRGCLGQAKTKRRKIEKGKHTKNDEHLSVLSSSRLLRTEGEKKMGRDPKTHTEDPHTVKRRRRSTRNNENKTSRRTSEERQTSIIIMHHASSSSSSSPSNQQITQHFPLSSHPSPVWPALCFLLCCWYPFPPTPSLINMLALVAASNTSSTPSIFNAEHSLYARAPISCATRSAWARETNWEAFGAPGGGLKSDLQPTRITGMVGPQMDLTSSIHCLDVTLRTRLEGKRRDYVPLRSRFPENLACR